MLEIFDLCRKIADEDVEPELAPAREGELQRSVLDPGRAAQELGWKPEVPLEQGLEDTWRWMRSA